MTPFIEHILVGTDFSTPSKRAAHVASRVASASTSPPTVTLFNAVSPLPLGRLSPFVPFGTSGEDLEADLRERARNQLRETRDECFGDVPARIVEDKHPHPALAICDAAEAYEADLVVIGTHGLTGLGRAMFGSVASRVLRHAQTDVLCIPERFDTERFPPRTITVATDFSRPSMRAVATAGRWARAFDASLELLHVVSLAPVHQAGFGWAFPPDLATRTQEMTDHAEAQLREVASKRLGDVRDVTVHAVVGTGSAERTVASRVNETERSMVVVGNVGRSGVSRLMLGSVAEGVARHSECAVLCVRAGQS